MMSLLLLTRYAFVSASPCPSPVPPSPPHYTPVKLEHVEQLELGYMPLRDDFERVGGVRNESLPSPILLFPSSLSSLSIRTTVESLHPNFCR